MSVQSTAFYVYPGLTDAEKNELNGISEITPPLMVENMAKNHLMANLVTFGDSGSETWVQIDTRTFNESINPNQKFAIFNSETGSYEFYDSLSLAHSRITEHVARIQNRIHQTVNINSVLYSNSIRQMPFVPMRAHFENKYEQFETDMEII